jgi:anti-sigma-K factor RskA
MMDRNTLLELIPAYAVDALDAEERQAVEALLERDPEAQALLADYEAITAMLPLAAPMRPAPSHLNNDLRSRLAARKINGSADVTQSDSSQPSPQPSPERFAGRGGLAAQSDNTPLSAARSDSTPLKVLPKAEKPGRTSPIAAWLVAAAAVLAVAIVGGFLLLRNQTPPMNPDMAAAKAIYDELEADSSSIRYEVTAAENLSVQGELLVSADGTDSVLRIASLPQIETEQSYQLWVATGEGLDSWGVYHWPTGHGPYYLRITVPVEELVRIGMTIEPYDGSPLGNQPSGEPVFGIQVASAQ